MYLPSDAASLPTLAFLTRAKSYYASLVEASL
jgi:hypothetical protein